jgi:hypothetical protein
MNTHALPALKEKRAAISGEVISLQKKIARLKKQLVSLDATISIFDPSYKVGSIKPKNARKRAKLFKMGELGRHIMDALRRADGKPLSSADVVAAVAAITGQDKAQAALLKHSVRSNLAYLVRRNAVEKVGDRAATKWRLTADR